MEINGLTLVSAYIYTVIFVMGLCIGSFLNVVALRLLSGESIAFPGSKCPSCQTPLKWYDNIPVLSWISLLGKCRYCKTNIHWQYPLVELSTAITAVVIVIFFGLTLKSLLLFILSTLLIVMTITDFREKVIFDVISFPVIPIGLLYNFFDLGHNSTHLIKYPLEGIGQTLIMPDVFVTALVGAIAGALFFEAASYLGVLMVGQRAFGEGDSIIAAGLGAWFGWQNLITIIILSFIFQLIFGLPVIVYNMVKDKDYKSLIALGILLSTILIPQTGKMLGITNNIIGALLVTLISFIIAGICIVIILNKAKERQSFTFMPFGPALVFGGFTVMFWGSSIINWYLGSFH